MNKREKRAWDLKHQLIVSSIDKYNDFDLDEINAKVKEMMKDEVFDDKQDNPVVSAIKGVLRK